MSDEPIMFCLDCRYPLDGFTQKTCPECGREFDPQDIASFAVDRGDLVKLYAGNTGVDVYVLRDLLAEEGIRSVVMGEGLGVARGDLPMTVETLPSLWVGKMDAERALPIAVEYDRVKREGVDKSQTDGDWNCPKCGEEVEGQFGTCWNCGTDRP